MGARAPGGLYRLYAGLTALGQPAIHVYATRRSLREGVSPDRVKERLGFPGKPRPGGRLVWFHAVSVGEALSITGLIEEMHARDPGLCFVVTTVSATSARLISERQPRALHQFAPVDTPAATRRFLDHWKPDLAVFVESEVWPRQIIEISARGIPLALVNARLSARSRDRWAARPGLARAIFARFDAVVAQTEDTASGLTGLGAHAVSVSGDLKAASARLPCSAETLAKLRRDLHGKSTWVAASTHPGEEEIVADAHDGARLLILVPRHPDRGDGIAEMLRNRGLRVAQRSKKEPPGDAQVYLADTLGELGLWYSLSDVVFMGGSLKPIGGHNPFEPAQLDCAILTGPEVANFRETYGEMVSRGAARVVAGASELAVALKDLEDAGRLREMQDAALRFASERESVRAVVADRLMPLLEERR